MKEELILCDNTIIHQDVVDKVKAAMPNQHMLLDLANLFKVFSDPTRVRILYALSVSEMCVCDIASLLNMTQSAISHQLRVLKQSRLVKYQKVGKVVYYGLDDHHVEQIFAQGLSHVQES